MRRFLATSLIILALAVSAAGAAPAARAQQANDANTSGAPLTTQTGGTVVEGLGGAIDEAAKKKADEAAAKSSTEVDKAKEASWSFDWVMTKIMGLFAWLVGAAGVTLNYAMYYTVVGMGTYVKNLSAIGLVWTILRDIGNILLIFGFLAIGISIIIDSDWYGGGQKLLPKLLIVAVFTNFSLFAAEAMVDVGNLFSTQIYKQISGGELPTLSGGIFGTASDLNNEHISTLFLNKMGLQTIYGDGKENTEMFKAGNSWLIGFMAILLFVITAFVMFSLAFILISRFIILILLIMVSPVGVAGLAVPGLQGWASKWWDTLFKQTITAPILLLMLYIALRVITDEKFLKGFGTDKGASWIGWATGTNSGLGSLAALMLSFLIAMGLLLAVVYFAKSLSAVGAGWATKTAGKLSFGATAWAGRRTIGRASNYTARKIRSSRIGSSETGRLLAGLADRGAKSSFDIRGTTALKNIPGGGIDAGAAQKGGYKKIEDDAIKARVDHAKSLKGRESTRSEKREIETLETNRAYAETLHAEVEREHKPIKEENDKLQAEVERLKKEKELRDKFGTVDNAEDMKLATASGNLVASEAKLAASHTKLAEAEERLKDRKEKEATAKADLVIATSAKSAQEKYAGALQTRTILGIPRAPYDWSTVAGSARRDAAEKIKKEAKKSKSDRDMDTIKKLLEDAEKTKSGDGEAEEEKNKK